MLQKFLGLIFFLFPFLLWANTDVVILGSPVEIKTVENTRLENGQRAFKLRIQIAEDHFVYVDSLSIQSTLDSLSNGVFTPEASPVIEFIDKFSGNELKQGVKDKGELTFTLPYNFDYTSQLELIYRACTDEFCYLPKRLAFEHGVAPPPVASSADSTSQNSSSIFNFSIDFQNSSVFLILFLVFIAGILTSFTPCIFPMIPITLALISEDLIANRWGAFKKTCLYVLGIATTYSVLGLIAASTGSMFGQMLSQPWVLVAIGIFYFIMASSMLGLFEINILNRMQNKMAPQKIKSLGGIFIFGAVTGLFASPCVGPVLIGILTYAAQSKNLFFSFVLLFIYALGLGQIFLAISLSGSLLKKLPRSGPWMNATKVLLALMLIGAGLFFMIPGVKGLKAVSSSEHRPQMSAQIQAALQSQKPVIIDFKADWCPACIEMDKVTFKDPEVLNALKDFELLKLDVTHTDSEKSAILKKYKVLGLPTILVFDKNGAWLEDLTATQYLDPKEMLQLLRKVKKDSETAKENSNPQQETQ